MKVASLHKKRGYDFHRNDGFFVSFEQPAEPGAIVSTRAPAWLGRAHRLGHTFSLDPDE
jgi:hypothetical protein